MRRVARIVIDFYARAHLSTRPDSPQLVTHIAVAAAVDSGGGRMMQNTTIEQKKKEKTNKKKQPSPFRTYSS